MMSTGSTCPGLRVAVMAGVGARTAGANGSSDSTYDDVLAMELALNRPARPG